MEVPKSPFTIEGLKQSGISAFNTFRKNPIKSVMSPMVPKNPYMAAGLGLTGIYGLLPESTKKFLTEGLPGGDFDRDFAVRESKKITDRIVDKSNVKLKDDDVETGPEKLEKGTPDLKVKKET